MATFEAVLFDLDGTLCRRTQDTQAMYEEAFERAGEPRFGEPAALWAALEGPPDHDDTIGYFGAGFARVAAQHGRSGVDVLALGRALLAAIDDTAVALTQGAADALTRAAAVGPVGIVTNGPERRQRPKLDALGIAKRFETLVYGAELARSKPHTLPFDRALEELGVARERTLYVGNSLGYDVAGAHNAGLPSAWLRGGKDGDGGGDDDGAREGVGAYDPDYVIDSLGELPAILGGDR